MARQPTNVLADFAHILARVTHDVARATDVGLATHGAADAMVHNASAVLPACRAVWDKYVGVRVWSASGVEWSGECEWSVSRVECEWSASES